MFLAYTVWNQCFIVCFDHYVFGFYQLAFKISLGFSMLIWITINVDFLRGSVIANMLWKHSFIALRKSVLIINFSVFTNWFSNFFQGFCANDNYYKFRRPRSLQIRFENRVLSNNENQFWSLIFVFTYWLSLFLC